MNDLINFRVDRIHVVLTCEINVVNNGSILGREMLWSMHYITKQRFYHFQINYCKLKIECHNNILNPFIMKFSSSYRVFHEHTFNVSFRIKTSLYAVSELVNRKAKLYPLFYILSHTLKSLKEIHLTEIFNCFEDCSLMWN